MHEYAQMYINKYTIPWEMYVYYIYVSILRPHTHTYILKYSKEIAVTCLKHITYHGMGSV